MNNEQQQIIDEAFKNYWRNAKYNNLDCLVKQEEGSFLVEMRFYYKEEFINKCKTDKTFSEKWGLEFEERELSHNERYSIYNKIYKDLCAPKCFTKEDFDGKNIPTKLITLTYKDTKIESYE